jgi:Mitotic-spindle organizing gamma-tubulin ring associated
MLQCTSIRSVMTTDETPLSSRNEILVVLKDLSDILDTQLTAKQLELCLELLKQDTHPAALATVITQAKQRQEAQANS